MSQQEVLKMAIDTVEHCVAIGYVDIGTGALLGVQTLDSHPSEVLNLVALATADLFAGQTIVQIEDTFKKARKTQTERHYFQEIIVNSDNLVHYFLRQKENQNQVAVFVCRNKVLLGMGLNQARTVMPDLIQAFV